jgi:hypothetical protein
MNRRDDMVRELEDWIERTFVTERAVSRDEVLRRADSAHLPAEEKQLLDQLPQAPKNRDALVDEIERLTQVCEPGGSAGGMEAGSSGEMRPGAYGGPPKHTKGGDTMGGYEP